MDKALAGLGQPSGVALKPINGDKAKPVVLSYLQAFALILQRNGKCHETHVTHLGLTVKRKVVAFLLISYYHVNHRRENGIISTMHRAGIKIIAYMLERGLTDEQFGKQIKASKYAVQKYKNGTRRAEARILLRIKEVTKGLVKEEDWYQDA